MTASIGLFLQRSLLKTIRVSRSLGRTLPESMVGAVDRWAAGVETRLAGKVNRQLFGRIAANALSQRDDERTSSPVLTCQSRLHLIEFEWLDAARPADHGVGNDTRLLAASFRHVLVKAADSGDVVTRIDFMHGGNSLAHCLYGFSHLEPWGTWTSGRRSALLVWLPENAPRNCIVEIHAGVFDAAFKSVRMRIVCDNDAVGDFILDGSAPVAFSLPERSTAGINNPSADQNVSLDEEVQPDVSIVMLNYNKPAMTFMAVQCILRSQTKLRYEIIILDNGSSPHNVDMLRAMDLPVKIVRLLVNRYFGEGNNIAVEAARAPFLCLLNNDAFLTDNSLDGLLRPLMDDPAIGIAGPVFRYPDLTMQEAGAFLNTDGTARQRGKYDSNFDVNLLNEFDTCDYVSAACLVIRTDDYLAMGGFDFRYDPAYYEDSDLCLRLRSHGKRTVVVRDVNVIHVENATSSDPRNKGIATDIVDRHRRIFLTRWGSWLETRQSSHLPDLKKLEPAKLRSSTLLGKTASVVDCVYTPFSLTHGGGERYILGVAQAFSEAGPTAVATPDEYSALRLNSLMYELGYSLYRTFPEIERRLEKREINRFVLMGNEALPSRSGYGRSRVYHCQFPFPFEASEQTNQLLKRNLRAYSAVVVNSEFTRDAYRRELIRLGYKDDLRVEIIPPPVRLLSSQALEIAEESRENVILSVGRFTPKGHSKRQDIILRAFAHLVGNGSLKGWRLVLCGMVPNDPDSAAYYEELQRAVQETSGAEILLAPSREQLDQLLVTSKIFVSATGFGVTREADAWKCEHFGITVAEAASAGCLPVVYDVGGPKDIVKQLEAGFTFHTNHDLEAALLEAASTSAQSDVRKILIRNSSFYSEERFLTAWKMLFEELS